MQSIRDKKKLLILLISIISGLAIIVTTVLATVLPRLNSFTTENKTAVTIGEIWDNGSFNKTNVNTLLETLSGVSGGTIDTISSNIDSSSGDVITAAQIRNYTTNKTSGQSVIVTFGGFEWIVTYLSKSTDGKVVATLWLSGEDTLDTSTFGNSSSYYGTNNPSSGVPTNMYGTSYIRAKLNNGGRYINITSNSSNPTSVSQTYSPVSNYKFADFVQGGVLTQYMVTPEHISWQENGQSAKTTLSFSYNLSNENWTNTKTGATDDGNFYNNGAYNYAGKTFSGYGNDTWKGDYLWLPSITETGYNSTYTGMWDLSVSERSYNYAGLTIWSRSAVLGSSQSINYYDSLGSGRDSSNVSSSNVIRPALHLNLSAVVSSIPTVGELWDSSSEQFNLDNVQSLLNVLSNSASGSIATISQNIDSNGGAINASTIRAYTTGKANGDTVTLNLGGFKWQVVYLSKAQNDADNPSDDVAGDVIVTLWFSGDEELEESTFGNNFSMSLSINGVPPNMYGTSYIRAVLNNGGNYINIISGSSENPTSVDQPYNPVSNYKFADFVQDGVLTEYMVTPVNISWQENQTAKQYFGSDPYTYNRSNEAWSDTLSSDGFYSSSYNYANKYFGEYGNGTWKNDYLWLPSITETGYNDTYSGMWGLNIAERSDYRNSSSQYSWSRTAFQGDPSSASYLDSSGGNYGSDNVGDFYAVRPALHLNLTAILYKTIIVNYDSAQGSVTGAGQYLPGDSATLTATPNPNYRFVSWTNSAGTILSTDPEYTFEVTDDTTITANFELITYNVTINVNDPALGQVLFNNNLTTNTTTEQVINTTLTLYAIANPNSAFICWQITIGGSTTYDYEHNPLTTTITADTTITAVFTNSLMDGIGVTALGGGQVRMGGYIDDGDPNTTVVLNAICYSGWTFDGWYTMENGVLTKIDALGNFTAVTINVADYDGKLIIAKFTELNNEEINEDLNNS